MNKINFTSDIQLFLEKNKIKHLHIYIREYSIYFPLFHYPISTDLFIENPDEHFSELKLDRLEKELTDTSLKMICFFSHEDFDPLQVKIICSFFHEYLQKIFLKIDSIKEKLLSLTLKSITQQILGVDNTQEYLFFVIKTIADNFNISYINISLAYFSSTHNQKVEYYNSNYAKESVDEETLNSVNFSIDEMVHGSIFYSKNDNFSDLSFIFELNYFSHLLSSLIKQCLFSYLFSMEHLTLINKLNESIKLSKTQIFEKDISVMKQFIKIAESEKNKNSLISKIHSFLITPLNSILGFTMLLLEYENNLHADEFKMTVGSINTNALFMQYSLSAILDFSLLNQKQFLLFSSTFPVSELYALLNPLIKGLEAYHNKSISLLPYKNDFQITFDKKRIKTLLFGLLFYLIKFAKKTGSLSLSIVNDNSTISLFFQIAAIPADFDNILKIEHMFKNVKNITTGNLSLEEFFLYIILNIVYESQSKLEIYSEKPDAKIVITLSH